MIGPEELEGLVRLRRGLHARPELSEQEAETARAIREFLEPHRPDLLHTGVGGHGVLAVFDSGHPGPCVAFRCELDALPIDEPNDFPHRSTRPGVSHKCGHDGHAATVAGLAGLIRRRGLPRGKAVLLFQPAEETGEGARAMLADHRLRELSPDWIFAMHNLPLHPTGRVVVRDGLFASASVGLLVRFQGSGSHSSYPEHGRSPAPAVAELIQRLGDLGAPGAPAEDLKLATVTQARVGELTSKPDFGVAPATGSVAAVLRANRQEKLDFLKREAEKAARDTARRYGLEAALCWHEEFAATSNCPEAAAMVRRAAGRAGLSLAGVEEPFRWSEDFGLFLHTFRGALFGLGSGQGQPQLHNEYYDYPDDLIATGLDIYWALLEEALAAKPNPPSIR